MMNPEFINGYGYMLLAINALTLSACIYTCVHWASLCLYDTERPALYKYMLMMLATSICAVLANSFALIKMFDSFLVVKMSINKAIVQNTLIDRFGMAITFILLLTSSHVFKKATCKED